MAGILVIARRTYRNQFRGIYLKKTLEFFIAFLKFILNLEYFEKKNPKSAFTKMSKKNNIEHPCTVNMFTSPKHC